MTKANVGKRRDAATGGHAVGGHAAGEDAPGEPLEPPPVSPARGPPTDWRELVQVHFRPQRLSSVARRAARDRHPQPLTAFHATVRTAREKSGFKAGSSRREKSGLERG
jgi:hypothetical protein